MKGPRSVQLTFELSFVCSVNRNQYLYRREVIWARHAFRFSTRGAPNYLGKHLRFNM